MMVTDLSISNLNSKGARAHRRITIRLYTVTVHLFRFSEEKEKVD